MVDALVTGDRSKWMIINKDQLPTGDGRFQKTIIKSSLSATPCMDTIFACLVVITHKFVSARIDAAEFWASATNFYPILFL